MHFPLDHEKLFTHISLFLQKALPEDAMLLYSVQFIIHSTETGEEKAFLSARSVPITILSPLSYN